MYLYIIMVKKIINVIKKATDCNNKSNKVASTEVTISPCIPGTEVASPLEKKKPVVKEPVDDEDDKTRHFV